MCIETWLFNFLTFYSSNMNFVLVFPLILAFLSSGHSSTTLTNYTCVEMCPRGYYLIEKCSGSTKIKCNMCPVNTYTDKENKISKCLRCDTCKFQEVILKPCTFNSNVVCDCKEGYYYDNPDSNFKVCKSCQLDVAPLNNPDYKKKCCKSCLNERKCQKICPTDAPSESTTTSTTVMNTTATYTRSTLSNTTSNPIIKAVTSDVKIYWLVLFAAMLAAFSCGLSLLFRALFESQGSCHCWNAQKDVEQHAGNPIINEQPSHQDSGSTTLTLNISEETPMMTLMVSPSTSEHPAHISPLLPHTENKAARQDQSKHLPAFVHYEIIKEVPLRRWKEFLRLLSVADEQLERAELEAGLGVGSMEKQYQMLRLWSQQPSASLNDVFSALHYMDLHGCAQQLQENLEKVSWWAESKQGFTACENHIDKGFSGAMQDT